MRKLHKKEKQEEKRGKIEEKGERMTKSREGKIAFFILAFILVVSILALVFLKQEPYVAVEEKEKFVSANASIAEMLLPAVDSEGNGVVTKLVVEAIPGNGRILVDIDNLLFWADTQQSIRVARNVARNITAIDMNNYDIIYSIHANASVIGGPSAGAALAIATIAALQNKSLNKSVMITGAINHDGSIGPVGEILAKAKAARDVNATLFLVPLLQSRDVTYETIKHCEKYGWTEVCTIEQRPTKIKVSENAGIVVTEVETVREALKYFFG